VVINRGMMAGDNAAIPDPLRTLSQTFNNSATMRVLLPVVALLDKVNTPEHAIAAGSAAFAKALHDQIANNLAALIQAISGGSDVQLHQIIKQIKDSVGNSVTDAIANDQSLWEKLTHKQDTLKGADYYFADISKPVPTTVSLSLSFSSDDRPAVDDRNYPGRTKWVPWSSVSQGSTTPGAPVTAVPWGQQIALFLVDPNGGIYTTGGDPQAGYRPWAYVPGISARPGSSIAAVPYRVPITSSWEGFALFIADPSGEVQTTSSRFPDYEIDGTFEVQVAQT